MVLAQHGDLAEKGDPRRLRVESAIAALSGLTSGLLEQLALARVSSRALSRLRVCHAALALRQRQLAVDAAVAEEDARRHQA